MGQGPGWPAATLKVASGPRILPRHKQHIMLPKSTGSRGLGPRLFAQKRDFRPKAKIAETRAVTDRSVKSETSVKKGPDRKNRLTGTAQTIFSENRRISALADISDLTEFVDNVAKLNLNSLSWTEASSALNWAQPRSPGPCKVWRSCQIVPNPEDLGRFWLKIDRTKFWPWPKFSSILEDLRAFTSDKVCHSTFGPLGEF